MRIKIIKSAETISVLLALCLAGLDFFFNADVLSFKAIPLGLFIAQTLLIIKPCPHEERTLPLFEIVLFALGSIFCAVSSIFGMRSRSYVIPVMCAGLTLTDVIWSTTVKLRRVATLFRCVEVWNNMEDYTKLIQVVFFNFLLLLYVAVSYSDSAALSVSVLLVVLAFYAHMLVSDSPSSLMGKRKKESLKRILEDVGLKVGGESCGKADAKMRNLYDRMLSYVTENKVYLEDGVKLEDLARELGTNKALLSRTINTLSGRNFNQFFNYFRVEEAIQYMQDHPDAVLNKVAYESGFHNTVSMNSAFALFKRMTPGEYMEQLREQK